MEYTEFNQIRMINRIMIRITQTFAIPDHEIEERFIKASGPGGQNVNRVATAVQLRFDIKESGTLPEPVKTRLRKIAHNQITNEDILIVEASEYRTQHQNRQTARNKFSDLIRQALKPPKRRKKTRPTKAGVERRLRSKKIRAYKKQLRQNPDLPN